MEELCKIQLFAFVFLFESFFLNFILFSVKCLTEIHGAGPALENEAVARGMEARIRACLPGTAPRYRSGAGRTQPLRAGTGRSRAPQSPQTESKLRGKRKSHHKLPLLETARPTFLFSSRLAVLFKSRSNPSFFV